MNINTIYNENCLDTMSRMPDGFIDLVVTSPPYDDMRTYDGYSFDFEPIAEALFRVIKEDGVVVWVVGDRNIDGSESGTSFRQALGFMEIGFKLFDTMIYLKSNPNTGATGERGYHQAFEYMFVFSKGHIQTKNWLKDKPNKTSGVVYSMGAKREHGKRETVPNSILKSFGRRTNVWQYVIGGGSVRDKDAFEHPAIFPEKLVKDHILSWSNKGDLVYDPFMGSGTTAVVSRDLGRNYIGSEISSKYCDIIHRRLNPPQLSLL